MKNTPITGVPGSPLATATPGDQIWVAGHRFTQKYYYEINPLKNDHLFVVHAKYLFNILNLNPLVLFHFFPYQFYKNRFETSYIYTKSRLLRSNRLKILIFVSGDMHNLKPKLQLKTIFVIFKVKSGNLFDSIKTIEQGFVMDKKLFRGLSCIPITLQKDF